MNTIIVPSFIRLLKEDPLYSNTQILSLIINSIALRYSRRLYFCGYLYGDASRPIVNDVASVEYKAPVSAKHTTSKQPQANFPTQPSLPMVYVFKPYTFKLKREFGELGNSMRSVGDDDLELQAQLFAEKKRLREEAADNNDLHRQFLAAMLATGLSFIHKDKILCMDASHLMQFIDSSCEGCLLEALSSITLASDFVSKYFNDNHLPLPTALYPDAPYNSQKFLAKHKFGAWTSIDPYETLKSFYLERPTTHSAVQKNIQDIFTNTVHKPRTPNAVEGSSNNYDIAGSEASFAFYKSGQNWVTRFNGGEKKIFNDAKGIFCIHKILESGDKGVSIDELVARKYGLAIPDGDKMFLQDNETFWKNNENIQGVSIQEDKLVIADAIDILNKELHEISEKMKSGEISRDIFINEGSRIKEQISIVYNTNRIPLAKTQKQNYDMITKNIRNVLKIIKEESPDLYNHIKSACKPEKGIYHYTRPTDIQWKLF